MTLEHNEEYNLCTFLEFQIFYMQHCKFDLDYITEASVISILTFNPFTFYPLRLNHYASQRTNNNWECNSIIAVLQEENKLRNNLSDDNTPLLLFSSALRFIHE